MSLDHWYVLGAGAMGCLWGANLARAGYPVTLLLRDADALAAFPGYIDLENRTGRYRVPVQAQVVNPDGEPIKRLLVTLKTHQTLPALSALHQRFDSTTLMVLMQNGMGTAEQVIRELNVRHLLVGTTTHGAWRRNKFYVVHAGVGESWIGNWDSENRRYSEGILRVLNISYDDDITTRLWDKLAVNCAINPVTALLQCRNGALLDHAAGPPLLKRVCTETAMVMTACGLARTGDGIYRQVVRVAEATAGNWSSMCQDLRNGAVTEIDAMNGYLVERGATHGLDLPCNRTLVALIHLKQNLPPSTTGT